MAEYDTRPLGYTQVVAALTGALAVPWAGITGDPYELTDSIYRELAKTLGVEEAAIRAVAEVEALGTGFIPVPDGRPKVLFEGQVFWKELKKRHIDPTKLLVREDVRSLLGDVSDIVYPTWDKRKYSTAKGEWKRLERAKQINEEAALSSASWGLFQIMGFHWSSLGYASPQAFVKDMSAGYAGQFTALGKFLVANNLVKPLQDHDWAKFARGYNGPGYAQNAYDTKLAAAYDRARKQARG